MKTKYSLEKLKVQSFVTKAQNVKHIFSGSFIVTTATGTPVTDQGDICTAHPRTKPFICD